MTQTLPDGVPDAPPAHIVITGASHPLATVLLDRLSARGHTLRLVQEDERLVDPEFIAPLLEGAGAVIHLAPLTLATSGVLAGDVLDLATRGTHVLLKAMLAAGIRSLVLGSSLAVMDAYDDSLEVTEQWRPRPHPVASELAPYLAELTAREFTRDPQIEAPPTIVCLRFAPLDGESATPGPSDTDEIRTLSLVDAAQAVERALAVIAAGTRQRGYRWQLFHVAAPSPFARYTSALAQQSLGYTGA